MGKMGSCFDEWLRKWLPFGNVDILPQITATLLGTRSEVDRVRPPKLATWSSMISMFSWRHWYFQYKTKSHWFTWVYLISHLNVITQVVFKYGRITDVSHLGTGLFFIETQWDIAPKLHPLAFVSGGWPWRSAIRPFEGLGLVGSGFCERENSWTVLRRSILVGGLEHFVFSHSVGNNHLNWLICFRGVAQPPTRSLSTDYP